MIWRPSIQISNLRPTTSMWVARIPVRAGVRAVGIAERDVDAGDLFVLQNVADHVVHGDVGADGELAHAVAVLIGMAVAPELVSQFLVGASAASRRRLSSTAMVSGVSRRSPYFSQR